MWIMCYSLLAVEEASSDGASMGLELLVILLVAGILLGLGVLLVRLGALGKRLEALDRLGSIDASLKSIGESQDQLELRRLEHLLVDIRDGQKRADQRLAQALEAREQAVAPESGVSTPAPGRLGERIMNRLLSQGYERIEILTPAEEFEALLAGDGEVRVEARRGGSAYKGRVKVQAGLIIEVQLRPPFSIFP
jgi:hypothetical protein